MAAIFVGDTAEAEHGAFLDHDWLASLGRTTSTSHRLDAFFPTEFQASAHQALDFVRALQAYSLDIQLFNLIRFGERSLPIPPLFHAIFAFLTVSSHT